MSGIYGYPTDPAQSTGTVGTSAGEGGTVITEDAVAVKALNNAMRGMAGDLGNWRKDISAANSTASASGTAYVLSTSSQISALADGIRLTWLPDADNTGAATLNVDTLGAKKLLHDSAVLAAGEIKSGHPVDCVYDASADSAAGAWLVLNPVVTVASTSDDVTNESGVTGASVTEALDQLDADKVDTTTTITAGTGLTGGGDLSTNRTINADLASEAEAEAGTDNTVLMTPLRTAQTIAAGLDGDVYRLEANVTSDGVITANWGRQSDASSGPPIATGVTETSGVFSFPSTGWWLCIVQASIYVQASDAAVLSAEVTRDNGSAWDVHASAIVESTSGNGQIGSFALTMIDVTDVGQVKVRFSASSLGTGSSIRGNAAENRTAALFLRLGAT